MRSLLVLAVVLACAGGPASAADTPEQRTRELRRQLLVEPDDQVVVARLAQVYLKGGSPEKARRLYRGLLMLENVALERQGGAPVWSHSLAASAMRKLDAPIRLGSR